MFLSSLHTDRVILEDLTQTIEILTKKYPKLDPEVISDIGDHLPLQMVEWVVRSISNKKGIWPEDEPRFKRAYEWFIGAKGDHKKLTALKTLFPNKNSKNILDFTLHEIEKVIREVTPKKQATSGNNYFSSLPGVTLAHKDGVFAAFKVEDDKTVSFLAKGTEWCTISRDVARRYLSDGEIYLITKMGKKYAQFYLEPDGHMQLMDVDDIEIYANVDSMLWTFIGKNFPIVVRDLMIEDDFYGEENVGGDVDVERTSEEFEQLMIKMCDPYELVVYASYAIDGPWPEAEPSIVKDPNAALSYAVDILRRRWPEAESTIKKDLKLFKQYSDFLDGKLAAKPKN